MHSNRKAGTLRCHAWATGWFLLQHKYMCYHNSEIWVDWLGGGTDLLSQYSGEDGRRLRDQSQPPLHETLSHIKKYLQKDVYWIINTHKFSISSNNVDEVWQYWRTRITTVPKKPTLTSPITNLKQLYEMTWYGLLSNRNHFFFFLLYTLTHRLYTQWALDKCVMFEMYLTKTKIGEKIQDDGLNMLHRAVLLITR